jgi:hypothetical protein
MVILTVLTLVNARVSFFCKQVNEKLFVYFSCFSVNTSCDSLFERVKAPPLKVGLLYYDGANS